MNKMDLSMTTQTAPDEDKPKGLWAGIRRIAIFAAPLVVIVGGGLLLAVMIATGPKAKEKGEPPHAPAVQFAVAHARPTTVSINVQGEARPRVEATLAAQVAGRLVWASPKFAEGGSFTEGEVMARIDAADYQLAVVRARAQVAQAQEGLTREEAEGELARQDWQALGRGDPPPLAVREPQMAQARAQLASAEASLRSAELDLNRASIRAPFTGRIRERRANVGDYVGPGSPVAVMFSTDTMEIRVPLTDADLASMRLPVGFSATTANQGPAAHVTSVTGGRIQAWEGRLVRTEGFGRCAHTIGVRRCRSARSVWSASHRAACAGHVRANAPRRLKPRNAGGRTAQRAEAERIRLCRDRAEHDRRSPSARCANHG
ncbi:MAG: efflux RND transporter periplasmic adaptor subunit [Caulobacteraceae bacterium]|nr:efflux RND transporter periplasmic adaptor subunit [Caulobacteraceae bacterium]